ncbi:RNA polymerase sigma factor [Chryseolinea lacunae]|uniref:Sigma-70 family RNA polymerase sigma factor n=1 Tax=Chryseolinea lacunae TaxID=2801331 RepID=A0ABS1KRW9_9BACT|nr:sigma-70 family RNA polymerase sigma factor [Chryseolinea lacunae]MBL0742058.1 sigma-70 family RNA polymerase sigma factor [Chryseolinea lacunae]
MNNPQYQEFLKDVNAHINIVHKVCRVYCPGHLEAEREDVFQEIMFQLWRSYPHFKGQSKFSTWMYKVALNTAITYVKKSARNPATEKLRPTHDFAETTGPNPEDEKLSLLYEAIDSLSPLDKAIILLYLEDNSYQEIAMIIGLTKTNVSVRLVRIKKALEERLRYTD